jgi:transposase InsO family protein
MKSVAQKAGRKQGTEEKKKAKAKVRVVQYANKHGVASASIKYKEHPSNIKRWRRRYNGDWRSLLNGSRRPHSHPRQHTFEEESWIIEVWVACGYKGIDYAYAELVRNYGYTRSLWGLFHALRRLGLIQRAKRKGRRKYRQCTPCEIPGEKVQVDVKVVPTDCIRGKHRRDGRKMYQYTAIDECTRIRFVYGYEEHTPENAVDFLKRLSAWFPFEIQCIQTDNGTEFTYIFISETVKCPFEAKLAELGIIHKLIKPRTPWHNGKVERSHRMDQRYFYDWESFRDMDEYNEKLVGWLNWTNNKPMRIFHGKSPAQKLEDYMWLI